MTNIDLWDFDALPIPEAKSPAETLKEQAEIFSTRMANSGIYAEMRSVSSAHDTNRLSFALDLVVPALSDYRLRVARCSFELKNNYPVNLISDYGEPKDEFNGISEVDDEAAFHQCLRSIFTDKGLRTSIASLLANVKI